MNDESNIVLVCDECPRRYEIKVTGGTIASGDVYEPQCLAMDCNGELHEE